jgi:hypothetical protein
MSVTSLDRANLIRCGLTILFGLIAIVAGVVRGSWETFGLGALALLIGCGLLAILMWHIRNPVRPAPMKLFGKRGRRP